MSLWKGDAWGGAWGHTWAGSWGLTYEAAQDDLFYVGVSSSDGDDEDPIELEHAKAKGEAFRKIYADTRPPVDETPLESVPVSSPPLPASSPVPVPAVELPAPAVLFSEAVETNTLRKRREEEELMLLLLT